MPLKKIGLSYHMDDTVGGERIRKKLSRDRNIAKALRQEILTRKDFARFGVAPPDYPLSELKDKFLAEVKPRVKEQGFHDYKVLLDMAFDHIGNPPLNAIRHSLNEYIAERKADGKSAKTLNRTIGLFKRMLAYGVQTTLILYNPVADMPFFPERRRSRRVLTPKEIKTLLKHSGKWAVIWQTFILTGLRKMELVRLKARDIDKKACTLVVGVSKTEAGERTVYIHSSLQTALWPLLRGKRPKDYVFTTERGTPHKNNLLKRFRECLKRAGINQEGLDLHSLRKTFASLLASVDAHQKKTTVMMGHSTTTLTADVYTEVYPEDLKEAVERIKIEGLVGK